MPKVLNENRSSALLVALQTDKDLDQTVKFYSSVKKIPKARHFSIMVEICVLCNTSTSEKNIFFFLNQMKRIRILIHLRAHELMYTQKSSELIGNNPK